MLAIVQDQQEAPTVQSAFQAGKERTLGRVPYTEHLRNSLGNEDWISKHLEFHPPAGPVSVKSRV